eukprot:2557682-Pyramimonas_sp.AAC.1
MHSTLAVVIRQGKGRKITQGPCVFSKHALVPPRCAPPKRLGTRGRRRTRHGWAEQEDLSNLRQSRPQNISHRGSKRMQCKVALRSTIVLRSTYDPST